MLIQNPATNTKIPRVEILPLIDVVFLVLIAFIYASMFLTHNTGLPVSLPESTESSTENSDIITLSITQSGEFYIDDRQVSLVELEVALLAKIMAKPNAVLFVKADHKAYLDKLVKVMDLAQKNEIKNLTIATDKIEIESRREN